MSNNFSKFKRGDIVETTYGTVGSVMTINKKDDSFDIRIKCTDGSQLTFDQDNLKFHNKPLKRKHIKFEDLGDKCPICSTKFKITRFGSQEWKDCLPCNKTAEDVVSAMNKEDDAINQQQDMFDFDDWDLIPTF